MQTYSYTPKRQNERPLYWFSFFCAGLIVSVFALVFEWGRPLWGQIGFIVCAVAGIWLYTRFFFTRYTYTVTLLNGTPTLIVTQRRGKQVSTVCQRDLSKLSELSDCKRGENNPHELHVDVRSSYLVSMAPRSWQTLYFILDGGECVSVTLEFNERFLSVIKDALSFLHLEMKRGLVSDEFSVEGEEAQTI